MNHERAKALAENISAPYSNRFPGIEDAHSHVDAMTLSLGALPDGDVHVLDTTALVATHESLWIVRADADTRTWTMKRYALDDPSAVVALSSGHDGNSVRTSWRFQFSGEAVNLEGAIRMPDGTLSEAETYARMLAGRLGIRAVG